jgi:GH25 family lysozyme M1 (1,4-beta-N-acetylmuramidase)
LTDTYLADISEFQPRLDAKAYLKSHGCLIVRVHNGRRADHMMPGRMTELRRLPFVALGWYQYLVANRDPAAQAREFIGLVGQLRVNEFAVLDLEEGSGDQAPRAAGWFNVVDRWADMRATLYSGLSYLNTNLGGAAHWKGRPIWVAAYSRVEPRSPHILWQYSDHGSYPGLPDPVDSSLHHGSAKEFIYGIRHAAGGGGVG